MNAPVIVIHTFVPSPEKELFPKGDHPHLNYQIDAEGSLYPAVKKGPQTLTPSAAIHLGFHCKARGGSLTEAQYQAGLGLITSILGQGHHPILVSHDSIISHHDIDAVHPHSCPGPFFPWARLRNDLRPPDPLIPIYQDGKPLTIGYLKMGTTYAPVQKVAKALGYTVRWDGVQNRIELHRE